MTIDGMVHIMPECRGMMGHYNLDRGWVEGSRPMMRLCTFGGGKWTNWWTWPMMGIFGADVEHVDVVRALGLADHVDVVQVRPWNLQETFRCIREPFCVLS